MTESLKSFFDNLPVNHWSSLVVALLSILCIGYSVYFFFSKEGQDERGKKIISTASFVSFIVTLVILFILNNLLYEVVSYNELTYSWVLNIVVLIISATEAIGILLLRKLN